MSKIDYKLWRNFQRICLNSLGLIAAVEFASLTEIDDLLRSVGSADSRAIAQQNHDMSMTCASGLKCDNANNLGENSDIANSQIPLTSATVTIESFQFTPNNIQLKKGGKVTFINKDTTPHTVTPEMGSMFTGTGRLANNESKTIFFDNVGVQKYFCEIHPSMTGQITVVD